MGQSDLYPLVWSSQLKNKLRFIDDLLLNERWRGTDEDIAVFSRYGSPH